MQAITAIIAFLGGVIAVAVTYRLNSSKEHVFYMRKKAEDLYTATLSYEKRLSSYFVSGLGFLRGELREEDLLDLGSKAPDGAAESHDNLIMLLEIYFPDAVADFDRWMDARGEMVSILNAAAKAEGRAVSDDLLREYDRHFDEFEAAAAAFKRKVVDAARGLTSAEVLWPRVLTPEHWRPQVAAVFTKFRRPD